MVRMLLKYSAIGLVASLLITGCSSKQEVDASKEYGSYIDNEFAGAPEWVLNPNVDGYIADIGSAKPNAGNDYSLQREEAIADARNNLVRQIEIKVNNMFKSYKTTTGTGDNGTYDSTVESVSKQIASRTLVGSKMVKQWRSKTGTLYVLVVLDSTNVANMIGNSIKTSFNNDEAMYKRFLADKAQGELEAELEKMKESN